jgi:tetratricopeptide (TPR) repeat protein
MSWRVEVEDSSGKSLDFTFMPGDVYKSKKEISVNGVLQPDAKSLPDEREIRNLLISNTAVKFTGRYRKTYDSLTVDLACSDELTPGNRLVEDSYNTRYKNWAGALRLWEAVKMKKKEYEGDRLYNMAVAYEALAFEAFDASGAPEDADPQFDKALELYQRAMTVDPEEKYIQRAAERLQISKNNLRRAKEQRDVREQELQSPLKLVHAEEAALQQLEDSRRRAMERSEEADADEEKVFRTYVRARLGSVAILDDEELDKVVSYGRERFMLDEERTFRVIYQETVRKDKVGQYREDFEIFAAKGVVTKNDRDALNVIAKSLALTADDVKTVESAYTFKDESLAAPARKRASSPGTN